MPKLLDLLRKIVGIAAVMAFVILAATAVLFPPPLLTGSGRTLKVVLPPSQPAPPESTAAACTGPAAFTAVAARNGAALTQATVSPFGAPEQGWGVYAPLTAHEIGTNCPATSSGFAATLANWQAAHGLAATGEVDAPTLSLLATTWLLRRPFVLAVRSGCPAAPAETALAIAAPAEAFGGKSVRARPAALEAYRRMIAAARRDLTLPTGLLTIASAYRGPLEEALRCAGGGCGGPARAHCSAHRTGLAFDLYLGAAPGQQPFSTADAARLAQAQSPAYGWLVNHAAAFGFVPYPNEPWHWEWTGEPP